MPVPLPQAQFVGFSLDGPTATIIIDRLGPSTNAGTLLPSLTLVSAIIDGRIMQFADHASKFQALAKDWERAMFGESVITHEHLSHFQIIGMGQSALPHVLDRLESGDLKWLYAAKCITGYEADTEEMENDADRIVSAWSEWRKTRGI